MQGRIFIARRPASDRMQVGFVTVYSATTDSELKRSGRELNKIYEFAKIRKPKKLGRIKTQYTFLNAYSII